MPMRTTTESGWKGSHLTKQVRLCLPTKYVSETSSKFPKPTPGTANSGELELFFRQANAMATPNMILYRASALYWIPPVEKKGVPMYVCIVETAGYGNPEDGPTTTSDRFRDPRSRHQKSRQIDVLTRPESHRECLTDKTVGSTAVGVLAHTVPYNVTYTFCCYAVGD